MGADNWSGGVFKLDSDVILGEDRRLDIHELRSDVPGHAIVRRAAAGVGMLVNHRNLYFDGSRKPRLHTRRETAVASRVRHLFDLSS